MPKVIEKRPNGTTRVYTIFTKPSRTQKQFKDEVNINKIMSKYKKTGIVNHLNHKQGQYQDLLQAGSYQESLDHVMKAQQLFNELPSELRSRLQNDPQKLIEFLADPKNDDEAIRLGLKELTPEGQKQREAQIAQNDKTKKAKKSEPATDGDISS
nr:MAG: internal scaffolding protein [Microvirus sp.]